MSSVFSEQILADKLSKLNSSQQCIETLSHWCIFHRSNAEVVVATWNEQYHKSQIAQKVPLLYLANDIMQNSKRNGNEFVTEFWKVLPTALKDLNENGDDQGKKVVTRLFKIWEERKVFGSRTQKLKDLMLGADAPPPLDFNSKKRLRSSVKIVKKDSRSIRTRLTVGGSAEKIVSAFHLVLNDQPTEDSEMSRCKSAINRVRKMEHDVDTACTQAKDPKRKTLAKDLEEEANTLKECIEKLKAVEAKRVALVTQLREALQEQESELENVRTQMQVAQAQADEAEKMKRRLLDENHVAQPGTAAPNAGPKSKKTAADIAADIADKLTASSSSQLIMTSVLSTFAAQEANKNAGLTTTTPTTTSHPPPVTPSRTSKLDPSDPNGFLPAQTPTAPTTPAHPYQPVMLNQPALQTPSPSAQSPFQYAAQTAAFGYGGFPPPPPAQVMAGPGPMMPLPPMNQQQQVLPLGPQSTLMQQTPQQPPILPGQQPPGPPSFRPLQLPGMMYFTQPHHNQ